MMRNAFVLLISLESQYKDDHVITLSSCRNVSFQQQLSLVLYCIFFLELWKKMHWDQFNFQYKSVFNGFWNLSITENPHFQLFFFITFHQYSSLTIDIWNLFRKNMLTKINGEHSILTEHDLTGSQQIQHHWSVIVWAVFRGNRGVRLSKCGYFKVTRQLMVVGTKKNKKKTSHLSFPQGRS